MNASQTLTIALGEYDTGWHDPEGSLARADALIGVAADSGAQLVVLPEMCSTGFTMESEQWAESPDGKSARRLADSARIHGVYLLAGLATTRGGRRYNSALLFSPKGELSAAYDKQRRFGFAGEDRAYECGSTPVIADIAGVRVSPFICYDLRSPELFRAVGPHVDAIVLVANWPASRQSHWNALVAARAVENQCYFVAVNRVGDADGLSYAGGSIARDPWGEEASSMGQTGIRMVTVARDVVSDVRSKFPFTDDRRGSPSPYRAFAHGWNAPPSDAD